MVRSLQAIAGVRVGHRDDEEDDRDDHEDQIQHGYPA
jgi:hypothetical protein